ncbi:hypothetical protein V5O48_008353 [Marasmius crinis-equi]|uniref:CHASE2 domain-containing protein n=1 Tax=Marasmius crinis-equi TaxID=585013 RepID=A0ABR3FEC3_9AGAR
MVRLREGMDVESVAQEQRPFTYDVHPTPYNDWPTLGEMITTGKRLVVFMDFGADVSQIWETPYDFTNFSFPCSIDRIWDPLPPEEHMYMINHSLNRNWTFLTSPLGLIGVDEPEIIVSDPGDARKTNGVPSYVLLLALGFERSLGIGLAFRSLANVARCAPLAQKRNPSFVLLDFVDQGEAFDAAEILNGFRPYPSPTASPSPSATSNSARAGSTLGWRSGLVSMGSLFAIGAGFGAALVI